MKRHFIYQDEKSHKFWTIDYIGNRYTVTYGKVGTSGSIKVKTFESEDECQKEAEKRIREKLRKGYLEKNHVDERETNMNETIFWQLIEKSRQKSDGEIDEQIEILTQTLTKHSIKEIIEFYRIFWKFYVTSYTSDLWAAAYIIVGGCSDDGFDYFRSWLIAQGEKTFHQAIKNPEILVDVLKDNDYPECEEMGYVAINAYEEKTEKDDFYDLVGELSFPHLELDWQENDKDLAQKFPKLWARFGEDPL